jgi:quinol monooxygenase YgiN
MSDPTSEASGPLAAPDSGQLTSQEQDPRPVCVIVNGRARADQIEQAKLALKKVAGPTRANPDCLAFRVYQDQHDPQAFIFWEQWASEEALWVHGERDYMAEYNAHKNEIFENLGGTFLQEIPL